MENETSWMKEILPPKFQQTIFSVNSGILFVLALSALPSNVLNMLVFRKLGLNTSINISFFSLSAADFACASVYTALGLIMFNMSGLIDLGIDLTDVQFILAAVFVSVSAFGSWVTALISVERCCCVVFPVTVKQVCTVRSTTGLIAAMLVAQTGIMATCLSALKVAVNASSPENPRPRFFIDTSGSDLRLYISALFWGASVPTAICFGAIVLSTAFLAASLRQRGTWLQSLPVARIETIATNRKLIGTVIAISGIYITCFLPGVLLGILYNFFPALDPFRSDQKEFSFTIGSFVRISQAASGVLNIFVYLKMNSRYREHLKTLLFMPCAQIRARVWQD